ncbi:MAG: tRNA lysidine(34) synthetase TilS [Mesorhizobium sp.]|nr:tRNA lysidine(34) synthetase TilS [Mesorhizobium sp.]
MEFSGLFLPFDIASRKSVIVAISGGSDSTALLLLLKSHVDRAAPTTRLVAVTVDHALREGSDREAAGVGALCARLGVPHRIMTWSGVKPATGISEAAREARHTLLAEVSEIENTDLVLTGHTADDQAETVLMRQARRGDPGERRGLAGIAPATVFEGSTWFARPLLQARRAALRTYLSDRGIGWIDDPTNVDVRYERPRQRMALSGPGGDVAIEDALILARATALQRQETGLGAARLIREHVSQAAPSLMRLETGFFREANREASIYALRILLAVAGGAVQLPDHERSAALHDRLSAGNLVRDTLAGALVDARKTGVFLARELRGLPGREAPEGVIWDGRYRIISAGDACRANSLGAAPPTQGEIPESLLRHAAATLPVPASGCLAIPVVAPWARYLPSFDIVPARAVAELVGAAEIPEPPLRGHIESKA